MSTRVEYSWWRDVETGRVSLILAFTGLDAVEIEFAFDEHLLKHADDPATVITQAVASRLRDGTTRGQRRFDLFRQLGGVPLTRVRWTFE